MTDHLPLLPGAGPGGSRGFRSAAPLRAADDTAWHPDTATAVPLLSALRLVEGRLHAARRRGEPTRTAAGPAVEAEQAVLQCLCDAGPLPLARLAERVRRDARGVGAVAARLAERGLVQIRAESGAGRGRLFAITLAGREASHRSTDREVAALERALGDWPRSERQRLEELVVGLAAALSGRRER